MLASRSEAPNVQMFAPLVVLVTCSYKTWTCTAETCGRALECYRDSQYLSTNLKILPGVRSWTPCFALKVVGVHMVASMNKRAIDPETFSSSL